MNCPRNELCVANDILYTDASGGAQSRLIGTLYGVEMDTTAGIIRPKIALSDGGSHRGIYESLHSKGLVDQVAHTDLLYVPVSDGSGQQEMYTFYGVSGGDEPSYVVYGTERDHANDAIALHANLSARALVLTLGAFYREQPKFWTPDQLRNVPDEDILS